MCSEWAKASGAPYAAGLSGTAAPARGALNQCARREQCWGWAPGRRRRTRLRERRACQPAALRGRSLDRDRGCNRSSCGRADCPPVQGAAHVAAERRSLAGPSAHRSTGQWPRPVRRRTRTCRPLRQPAQPARCVDAGGTWGAANADRVVVGQAFGMQAKASCVACPLSRTACWHASCFSPNRVVTPT